VKLRGGGIWTLWLKTGKAQSLFENEVLDILLVVVLVLVLGLLGDFEDEDDDENEEDAVMA
jgi:hypothetical protein